MSHSAKFLAWFCSLVLVAIVLSAGCGRSDLDTGLLIDGGIPDSNFDAGQCNATTCGNGCCDSVGNCQAGTLPTACGTGGGQCATCSGGAPNCDVQTRVCQGAPSCNVATCPSGCCDSTGACQVGGDVTACGLNGATCADCIAEGFAQCDPGSHVCETPEMVCDSGSCPNGCCEDTPSGTFCLAGSDDSACGIGSEFCQNCASVGEVCDPNARDCAPPQCGPESCGGCCFGNQCIMGDTQNACGQSGQQCVNCGSNASCSNGTCTSTTQCSPESCNGCCDGDACLPGFAPNECGQGGETCFPCAIGAACIVGGGMAFCEFPEGGPPPDSGVCGPENCKGCCDFNGQCEMGDSPNGCGQGGAQCIFCPPGSGCISEPGVSFCAGGPEGGPPDASTCGPFNCMGCCDGNGVCQGGNNTNACGVAGARCDVCAPKTTCAGGQCVPTTTCTAANCAGCCNASGVCEPGFLDTACGSQGKQCTNCSQEGSTCDSAVAPRTCESQQMTCPATYASCPAGTTLAPPPVQHVCPAADLQNAQTACRDSATSGSCMDFFTDEQLDNPSCYSCLVPFDVRFQSFTGLLLCVAPFVDPMCDQALGCAADCANKSCMQCPTADAQNCKNEVVQGQCGPFFQNLQCALNAFGGGAMFCNPQQYQDPFGSWLAAVGQHYCGQ